MTDQSSVLMIEGVGEAELRLSRRRKTLAIEIRPDGGIVVHAPARYPKYMIADFVRRKQDWIQDHLKKMQERADILKRTSQAIFAGRIREAGSGKKVMEQIRRKTRRMAEEKTADFARQMGVTYQKISIRAMTSRWGSCSSQGNLSFHLMLSELPEEIMDYVIIHELCHRLEMNHSPRFWAQVARMDPDFQRHRKFLALEGPLWLAAMDELRYNR